MSSLYFMQTNYSYFIVIYINNYLEDFYFSLCISFLVSKLMKCSDTKYELGTAIAKA
ncbi:hypothetical protein [Acinetobacter baumannii]|uniref:hypothetical protein n=2 Tax=Acinetobacter baumannii TaxID=470 RepID=UPI0002CE400E|nr:hypothetical protein [Acinetobacter baumannii]EHU2566328.1 hypothetical protein [Acinetobacter baumannii]EKT7974689.1 hypothetical protein [Acinetobacter baumannii]EKU1263082.1 hypothetical protein [Acinetobacter baumannii]EKV6049655.1 hypothetical protein [Acinetobacter baumannii]ENW40929.1 hypothetical protein F920_03603 [Acinetobacter baumannii NIPH 335]